MKRILVPINHETASLMAADMAAFIAASTGAEVDLVYVREHDHAGQAESRLTEARARFADSSVVANIHRLEGPPIDGIAAFAAGADLIVMRNRTRMVSTDAKKSVSKTTLGVLKTAPCPVLVCTERASRFEHPLIAYNGSAQSRAAATRAIELMAPRLFQSATILVVTTDDQMADRLFVDIETLGGRYGLSFERYWSPGKPSDVILSYLEERGDKHDLVVMGAYGRAWLREKIFGSTTESVLQLSTAPVLLTT